MKLFQIKPFVFIFSLCAAFALLLSAAPAQADTVDDGLRLVDSYFEKSSHVLSALTIEVDSEGLMKNRTGLKESTKKGIKKLAWSEEPGIIRFKKLRNIVDSYMLKDIGLIESSARGLGPAGKMKNQESHPIDKLYNLSEDILRQLHISFNRETAKARKFKHKEPPAVPSVDTPVRGQLPAGHTRGIYDR